MFPLELAASSRTLKQILLSCFDAQAPNVLEPLCNSGMVQWTKRETHRDVQIQIGQISWI